MAVKVLAAPIVRDANLSLFGISHSDHPTRSRYPKVFNPQALRLWESVLSSDAYVAFRERTSNTQSLWTFAVQAFLKRCGEEDVYPFAGQHDFEGTAKAFLTSSRRKLVQFFTAHGFFEHLRVSRVERSANFTAQNFSVECIAHLKPIEDPTFDAWLTRLPEPAFVKSQDGSLTRSVHAHIEVFYRVTRTGAVLGYRIFCHTPLRLIDGKLPTKKRMLDYVDRNLWRPIVKEHPIPGINKLF